VIEVFGAMGSTGAQRNGRGQTSEWAKANSYAKYDRCPYQCDYPISVIEKLEHPGVLVPIDRTAFVQQFTRRFGVAAYPEQHAYHRRSEQNA